MSNTILGFGQFSCVKKATNWLGDKKNPAAIKCIRKSKERSELLLLKREFVICKTIRHPNIVECYDIYEDKENYYIVMEYCEDGTLKDKLEQYTTIPESEAKDIIA